MLSKCSHFATLVVFSLLLKGARCFFVIYSPGYSYSSRRRCIDIGQIQSNESWGNLFFLEFSYDCLDPAAQFRFRDNGAMLNLKRQGCLAAFSRPDSGYNLDMFYLYVDSVSLDRNACAQKPDEGIYRAITQTPERGLSVYYKRNGRNKSERWCAQYAYSNKLSGYYMGLTTQCQAIYHSQKFIFGSVTCYGNKVDNANCPKNQYMVVKIASYRGLLATKTCGSSDEYSCEVDVTCRLKKYCDGKHECRITVDKSLFSGELCPGLSNYLYFEYQCVNIVKPYKGPCVYEVSLSYSSVPYKGVVQITTDIGTKSLCWQSLENKAKNIVCRHLGYNKVRTMVNISTPTDAKDETFSGSVNCNGEEKYLSQCSINASASDRCPELSYIECTLFRREIGTSYKPILKDKRRFPNSTFGATASIEGHSAANARISSGSSWCAPISVDKHYLQVDLRRMYRLHYLVTYGDSTSSKWVVTYKLNYTNDLMKWKALKVNGKTIFRGNTNGYDHAAGIFLPYITTKALRFIPLTYVGQPCVRVDTWGKTFFPDKPRNFTVTNIASRSAEISWLDPKNRGIYGLTHFKITLKNRNSRILDITDFTGEKNRYKINNLTPCTTYIITIAAANNHGYEQKSTTSFSTPEEAPSGSPVNIKTIFRSASSLFFTWDPPEKNKQNCVIIRYAACVAHSEHGPCFQTFTASDRKWLVGNLNASTKYFIRVLASTKVGHGSYSKSIAYFTNERRVEKAISRTSSTLTFSLEIPSKNYLFFYVVALKLKNDKLPTSSDNYENNELVTYVTAEKSTNPKPYVAAVVTSSGVVENEFILGDSRSTVGTTLRTTSNYFNGPLEPGTSYSIFLRIVINQKGDYYSTDWSPPSKTDEDTALAMVKNDDDESKKYLIVAIIVLATLLVISFVLIAYMVNQIRRLKSSKTKINVKQNEEKNSRHIYDIPENSCELVEKEQSTYTPLKKPAARKDDNHLYGHLNQVLKF